MEIFRVTATKQTAFEPHLVLFDEYWQTYEDAEIVFLKMIDKISEREEIDFENLQEVINSKDIWWYKRNDSIDFPDEYSVSINSINVLNNKK